MAPTPGRDACGAQPRAARLCASYAVPALTIGLALLLSACAVQPSRPVLEPPVLAADWPSRRAQLQSREDFELRGRVAAAAGDQGFSAGLHWRQEAARGVIRLDGPLGVGGLVIELNGEVLRLATSRGETLDDAAARGELERQLGFELPLAALRYWVRGVPQPAVPAIEALATDAPQLATLEQSGWRITYGEYGAGALAGWPRRMVVEREGARLKLLIERWDAR